MKGLSAFLVCMFFVLAVGAFGFLIFNPDNTFTIVEKIIYLVLSLIFLSLSSDIYVKNEISKNTDATADILNSINEKLEKLLNTKSEGKEDEDANVHN